MCIRDRGKDTVVEKTYAQYVQDIRKATGYLQQELGEPKGKKSVILSRTSYEYGAVVFGTMMAGAVIVTLNPVSYTHLALCADENKNGTLSLTT